MWADLVSAYHNQRNVMRGPASLAFDSSDTFEKMAKKTLQAGAQNLASSEEFRNSEVGRFIKELEKKAQAKVKLWAKWMRGSSQSSESENQNRGPEVALIASPAYAGLKLKSTEMETSCGYSVQNKSMDLLIGSPSSSGSFGMGYTPQDQSSTVKMQWNW
jgi:hypothetical protein